MGTCTVIETKMYDQALEGASITGSLCEIIGEQKVEQDGKIYDLYLYNIKGYMPRYGLPFAAIKENLIIF